MAQHAATIVWSRGDDPFVDNDYSRAHEWQFDGGARVPASASPHIVPAPHSVAVNVDPEEAFVAALASCHMLFFLSLAAKQGVVVDDYRDEASGTLQKNADGKLVITTVTLRPAARYHGDAPATALVAALHEDAHHQCFIANSVTTDIVIEIIS